jgi:hypothetical protein
VTPFRRRQKAFVSKSPKSVQCGGTGTYFGRVKIGGKTFRESLETDVFTTAKLRLPDFIKKKRELAALPIAGTFGHRIPLDAANDLALLKADGRFAPLPIAASRTMATVGFPDIGLQGFASKLAP